MLQPRHFGVFPLTRLRNFSTEVRKMGVFLPTIPGPNPLWRFGPTAAEPRFARFTLLAWLRVLFVPGLRAARNFLRCSTCFSITPRNILTVRVSMPSLWSCCLDFDKCD